MGYFKNLEIEILELYFSDGADEYEIAQMLGIPEQEVNRVLDKHDEARWNEQGQDFLYGV